MMHTNFLPNTSKLASIEAPATTRGPVLFDITPVIHPQNGIHPEASRTFWSATANALYIKRQNGEDMFGKTPDFAAKLIDCPDLITSGRRGPIGCDADGLAGMDLWRRADDAALEDRPSSPVAFHVVGWLPTNKRESDWRELILQFLDTHIVANGMIADWALHALADGYSGWIKKPHMHAVITSRFWRGPRVGQPHPAWFATSKSTTLISEAWESFIPL